MNDYDTSFISLPDHKSAVFTMLQQGPLILIQRMEFSYFVYCVDPIDKMPIFMGYTKKCE